VGYVQVDEELPPVGLPLPVRCPLDSVSC